MSTKMNSNIKRNVVVDDNDYGCLRKQQQPTKSKRRSGRTTKAKTPPPTADDDAELDILLQQQRIKEKQLLLEWKALRETEKKIKSIMRNQSRDTVVKSKEYYTKIDGNYDIINELENRHIWKHAGCNAACKADDCQQWIMDYLYYDLV